MAAGQHPERLPQLEITHADHAHRLVVLTAVARISGEKKRQHEEGFFSIYGNTYILYAGLGSILDTVSKDTEDTALSSILSVS